MASRFSRMLRGKHHDVWKQFALDSDGTYIEGNGSSHGEVRFDVHGHSAVLEADVTMVMVGKILVPVLSSRFVVQLPAVSTHRFSVSAAGFGSALARWFGAQDIAVGDDTFDDAFVLKGVDPVFVQQIFADTALRILCQRASFGTLQRRDDKQLWSDPTPGIDPLELSIPGFVDDADKLQTCCQLFTAALGRQPEVTAAVRG